MKKNKIKAFTLVELIVVITILIILWTIAFISLQWYSKSSRDSVRLTDINLIKKSLELYNLKTWNYPLPSNFNNIIYSWSTAWYQWTFGESTFIQSEKLNKLPIDPLIQTEYAYSITNSKKEFEIATILEWNDTSLYNNKTFAGNLESLAHVSWNYNGKILKVLTWSTTYVLSVPSIITSTWFILDDIIINKKLVYNWYKNLPLNYKNTIYNTEWEINLNLVNEAYFVVFKWDINDLIKKDNTSRIQLLKNLQYAYSWTLIENVNEIKEIINVDVTNENKLDFLSSVIINNNLWWNLEINNTNNENCLSMTNWLVWLWHMDNNWNDSSNSNNNAIPINWASFNNLSKVWTFAWEFNWINQHIEISNIDLSSWWTISSWVKLDDLTKDHAIIWQDLPWEFQIWFDNATNDNFAITIFDWWRNNKHWTTIPNDTSWYHVVFTYNWNIWKLFVNWLQENTDLNKNWTDSETWVIWIWDITSSKKPFDWLIDEVAIYNRALTELEISDLYNAWLSNKPICNP